MIRREQQSLGARARQRSVQAGVCMAGCALALGFVLHHQGAVGRLGWFIGVPVTLSAYFLITGSLGLCVYHATVGRRATDHGEEAMLDPAAIGRLRRLSLLALGVSVAIGVLFATCFVTSV
jgi:hypothetical protein